MARKATDGVAASASRYEQVKAILDAAAGTSSVGLWRRRPLLGRGRRETESGARLRHRDDRAGAARPSCCEPESRSARSGLIRGLRGVAPFDGTRFPPLPWGGTRVADADIAFIADWIDDGLPADDHSQTIDLGTLEAKGGKVARLKLADVAEFERRDRREALCLSRGRAAPAPESRLPGRAASSSGCARRSAPSTISTTSAEDRRNYNNQALIHQNHCQHGWERFLPWHRAYLYEFEQNLQDFDRDIMLPYWDWTMPQYRPEEPDQRLHHSAGVQGVPHAGRGRRDDRARSIRSPTGRRPTHSARMAEGPDGPMLFVSQHDFFCYVIGNDRLHGGHARSRKNKNRQRMIDALLAANSLWYPLRYPAEYAGGGTINTVIHYHYPTGDDMAQILEPAQFPRFRRRQRLRRSFGFLDQNPHNTMHIWTGGHEPRGRSDHRQGAAELRVRRGLDRNRRGGAGRADRREAQRHDGHRRPQIPPARGPVIRSRSSATCSPT